jgi:hypothetical protein
MNDKKTEQFKELESLIRPMAQNYERFFVPINASSMMDDLAGMFHDAIYQLTFKDVPFSKEEIIETFRWLVDARVMYSAGGRIAAHPKDIEYPAILGAILQTIGRFQDMDKGIELIPLPSDASWHEVKDGEVVGISRKKALEKPACYDKVISHLKLMGVPMVFGLPMDKLTETDELFALEVIDGFLNGVRPVAPNGAVIAARVLLNFKFLTEVFGSARVTYAAVATFRSALESVVQRNIRGLRIAA